MDLNLQRPDLSKKAQIKDWLELIDNAKDLIAVYNGLVEVMPDNRYNLLQYIRSEENLIAVLKNRIRRIVNE